MLNQPAGSFFPKDAGAFAAVLRVKLAVADGLEDIVVRGPGSGACHMGAQIRDGAEEVHPAPFVEPYRA